MKVSEAKTKICPFIQDYHKKGVPTTKDNGRNYPININCICGYCMAWEYTTTHIVKYAQNAVDEKNLEHDGYKHDDINRWEKELEEDDKSGYCKRIDHD